MAAWEGGKGDDPRKMLIPLTEWELKHSMIWGTKEEKLEAATALNKLGVYTDEYLADFKLRMKES